MTSAPTPPALTDEQRRLVRDAIAALDRTHAAIAQIVERPAEKPLSAAEARAAFAASDDYARLCARLGATSVPGPMLDAGLAAIDALRLTIVARGWHASIDILAPEAYVETVAARYGLGPADASSTAEAARQSAEQRRRAVIAGV